MRRFIIASSVVLAVLVFSNFQSVAEARGKSGQGSVCPYSQGGYSKHTLTDKFFHKYRWIMESRDEIGLTDDQASDLKSLKHDFKRSIILVEAQIDVLALDVRSAMHQNPIDVAAVNALVDKKYDLKKTKAKSSVEAVAKLKPMITAEQCATLKRKK